MPSLLLQFNWHDANDTASRSEVVCQMTSNTLPKEVAMTSGL